MKVYLDNENTTFTPMEVIEAMLPYFNEKGYGHPAILHEPGREALDALERSKEVIARSVNANPDEIIFTSGGTESNNLAVKGILYAYRSRGNHVITTKIEHQSIRALFMYDLEKEGFKVDYLDVDSEGFINVDQLRKLISDKTVLVTINYVNHEIGTIEPIKEVSEVLSGLNHKVFLHTNAINAYTRVPIDVEKLNLDLVSLSSHKIHGPKGVGALYVRDGVKLKPLIRGAISTQHLRPGIENIPGIVGFAKAVELAFERFDDYVAYIRRLRDKLMNGILNNIPYTLLNGPRGDRRAPHNLNVSFLYAEGEAIALALSMEGIYVSTGSACATRELAPSHVLVAIGRKHEEAHGSIQFSISRYNTDDEIDYVLDVLPNVVKKLRDMSPWKPEAEVKAPGEYYHRGGR